MFIGAHGGITFLTRQRKGFLGFSGLAGFARNDESVYPYGTLTSYKVCITNMNKLLIICGPTATGKTKLAIDLAKKFNGEIVSADSRQVYRRMDIGTGKDISASSKFKVPAFAEALAGKQNSNLQIGYYEISGVKIWLLDIVKPDYKFNVADYKKCADMVLDDIWKRGKLPILVGGTGFYIKAVVDGIETMGVEPDWKLREQLSHCSIASLLAELKKIDPERSRRMNESDRQNPRRLVRTIEIAKWSRHFGESRLWRDKLRDSRIDSGPSFAQSYGGAQQVRMTTDLKPLFVGLIASNQFLYERIDQRVEERVRNGLEGEIRGLLANGYSFDNSALGNTLAYSEWKDYFNKKASEKEIIQKWKFDEHNYARRQLTWFRKNEKINWFDITKQNWQGKVERVVNNWYTNKKK